MKLLAIPAALAVVALTVVTALLFLTGGDTSAACGTGGASGAVLAAFRQLESSGNYQAHAAGSSASGAYGIVDTTWAGYGGYIHAADAPPAVQDTRAQMLVDEILAHHDNDITALPVVWYLGHLPAAGSNEWDQIPQPDAGNTRTPRQYQQAWLDLYHQYSATAAATTTAATAATSTTAPDATATTANIVEVAAGTTSTTSVALTAGACAAVLVDGYALPVDRAVIDPRPGDLTRPHHDYPALDYPTPTGTRVYAIQAGTVTRISTNPTTCYPDPATCTDICGLGINITDPAGVDWIYCHASQLHVTLGDHITAGQQIMDSGNSGHSSGPHLHLGIRIRGIDHCPQPLLESLYQTGRAVDPRTLPTTGCTTHS